MPSLQCYEKSSTLLKLRRYGFHVQDMGCAFYEYTFSVFSVMAGWIAEMLFMLFFAYVTNTVHSSVVKLIICFGLKCPELHSSDTIFLGEHAYGQMTPYNLPLHAYGIAQLIGVPIIINP